MKDKYRYFQVTKLRIAVDPANRGLQGNFCKVTGRYQTLLQVIGVVFMLLLKELGTIRNAKYIRS